MFEHIETGAVISEWELKELFPYTLFPAQIADDHIHHLGYRHAPAQPQQPAPSITVDPIAARRATYAAESDHLKIEAEYDALVAGTAPDYTAWIAAVTAIKERYPLETSSDE